MRVGCGLEAAVQAGNRGREIQDQVPPRVPEGNESLRQGSTGSLRAGRWGFPCGKGRQRLEGPARLGCSLVLTNTRASWPAVMVTSSLLCLGTPSTSGPLEHTEGLTYVPHPPGAPAAGQCRRGPQSLPSGGATPLPPTPFTACSCPLVCPHLLPCCTTQDTPPLGHSGEMQ